MCNYCEGKEDISNKTYSDGSTFSDVACRVAIDETVTGKSLTVRPVEYRNGKKIIGMTYVFNINYCPMCGKKLGEGPSILEKTIDFMMNYLKEYHFEGWDNEDILKYCESKMKEMESNARENI